MDADKKAKRSIYSEVCQARGMSWQEVFAAHVRKFRASRADKRPITKNPAEPGTKDHDK